MHPYLRGQHGAFASLRHEARPQHDLGFPPTLVVFVGHSFGVHATFCFSPSFCLALLLERLTVGSSDRGVVYGEVAGSWHGRAFVFYMSLNFHSEHSLQVLHLM